MEVEVRSAFPGLHLASEAPLDWELMDATEAVAGSVEAESSDEGGNLAAVHSPEAAVHSPEADSSEAAAGSSEAAVGSAAAGSAAADLLRAVASEVVLEETPRAAHVQARLQE